jgi:hypothetical protein
LRSKRRLTLFHRQTLKHGVRLGLAVTEESVVVAAAQLSVTSPVIARAPSLRHFAGIIACGSNQRPDTAGGQPAARHYVCSMGIFVAECR